MDNPYLEYISASLHRYTFQSAPIKEFVLRYCKGRVLNLFAGMTVLPIEETRNDIDTEMPAEYHLDALDFVCQWDGEKFDTVILDPPYSIRKSMEFYSGHKASHFQHVKENLIPLLNPKAHVITLGYNSTNFGEKWGFKKIAIGLVNHYGAYHDTIISIERREDGIVDGG